MGRTLTCALAWAAGLSALDLLPVFLLLGLAVYCTRKRNEQRKMMK